MLRRLAKFCFDLRTLGRRRDPVLPIQQPKLHPWPPLHIEKRVGQCCEHCLKRKKKRRRDQLLLILLIILLLYLLGNTVALDILTNTGGGSTSTSNSDSNSNSNSAILSANQQLCLSEFEINAPANATLYPCSTCLPTLQVISSAYLNAHAQDATQVQNAIQFCALRSVFVEANGEGQSSLGNGGWMQTVDVCGWSGVDCDGSGRVSSLELNVPGIPTIVPDQLGALTNLQTLQVVGDNQYPAGSLPSSFTNLTALATLELQATGITSIPDGLFDSLKNVTSLTLEKNVQMSSTLPSSVAQLPMQNLVITNQVLTNPLSTLLNSTSIQSSLKLLDFSTTNMTGSIPASVSSLKSLVELHLDHNDLTNPLPSSFPSTLEIIDLANNTGLSGSVDGSFCALGALQQCDMTGTGLKAAGSCGVCQFS
ncbi:L domain-like protein [Daedalea quercina L-15889]|uniref:L domain-like protein n=1 Tax=Daedalea quercina L-15889 TaxID=1314783 RepID=A0A165QLS5_9APHY|nr:L domain-like protein [Daedalea quercina L-15889]